MTADVHALTGAYAINAIPEFERAEFERHLAECEACAQEVRELQATATRLGEAASTQPPPELKGRVLARIAEVRQLPPLDELAQRRGERERGRSPWITRVAGAAAALLLVVSVSLGVLLVQSRQDLDTQQQAAAAMTTLLASGDAKVVSGSTTTGINGTVVVSRERGQVMLLAGNVPSAPGGKTYQVWLMGEGGVRSIGLAAPDAQGRISLLDAGGVDGADGIGVTVEPAGGSPAPTSDLLMRMTLPV